MKSRIVNVLIVLTIVFSGALPVRAAEFNQEVRESIVYVEEDIVIDGEYIGAARGTGFFVGVKGEDPQYIVTNHHVIADFLDVGGGQAGSESRLYVAFSQNDVEEAYVVDYNDKTDIAVLRLAKATSKRKPLIISTIDSDNSGDTVYAVGFPLLSDVVVDSVSSFGIDDVSVTSGTVGRVITEQSTGRKLIQMNTPIFGGNSGGALVNTDGNVIGVNTMGAIDSENMNYAVSMEEVIPILKNNNIVFDIVSGHVNNNFIFVIIAIVAVVLVVACVVLIVVTKSSKKKNAKGRQPVPVQPQPVPVQQPQPKPVIYSVLPEHGGMKVNVEGRQVQIGRSSSCQMVFGGNTPGVSRNHCQISWDTSRKEFVLMDMKSSYGTFLSNGQKLNPGVPYYVKPGESFYLGDRVNEIRTELR